MLRCLTFISLVLGWLALVGCGPTAGSSATGTPAPGTYWVQIDGQVSHSGSGQVIDGRQNDYRIEFEVPGADGNLFAEIGLLVPAGSGAGEYQICYKVNYDLGQCPPQTIGLEYRQVVEGALIEQDEFASGTVTLDEGDGLTGEFSFYANFFDASDGSEVTGAFYELPLPGASQ